MIITPVETQHCCVSTGVSIAASLLAPCVLRRARIYPSTPSLHAGICAGVQSLCEV